MFWGVFWQECVWYVVCLLDHMFFTNDGCIAVQYTNFSFADREDVSEPILLLSSNTSNSPTLLII